MVKNNDNDLLKEYRIRLEQSARESQNLLDKFLLSLSVGGIALSVTLMGFMGLEVVARNRYYLLAAMLCWIISYVPYIVSHILLVRQARKVSRLVRDGKIDQAFKIASKEGWARAMNFLHAVLVFSGVVLMFLFFYVGVNDKESNSETKPSNVNNQTGISQSQFDAFQDRVKAIEKLQSKLLSYQADAHIDYLKTRLGFALWCFGGFSVFLAVLGVYKISQATNLNRNVSELRDVSGNVRKDLDECQSRLNRFDISHMNYNARIFNSLAHTFEHLADAVKPENKSLSDISLEMRSALLQTAILYLEQSVVYNMESKSYEKLFVPVHGLASLMVRIDKHEFPDVIPVLKERLLAKHIWEYSTDEIATCLKNSSYGIAEIQTAVKGYDRLTAMFGRRNKK